MVVMSFRTPSTRDVFAPGFTAANYPEALLDPDFYYLRHPVEHHDARCHWSPRSVSCWAIRSPTTSPARARASRASSTPCILSPLLVGVVVRCYGWIIILANNDGLINNSLRSWGW